jgi:dTDP-glucose 4,6-dehydratase
MILVTGGAGFIGSNFVKLLCNKDKEVVVVDNLTYASNYDYIKDQPMQFVKCDITDKISLDNIFKQYKIDTIFHFAAESHVDNSIKDCMPFVYTNIVGTINLLDMVIKYNVFNFIQVSTDEVFGSIDTGYFNEDSQIQPRNPYSASKASAEHFVNAYANTYGLNTIIVNSSNNYGPNQYREKLIPMMITNLMNGEQVPVYGDGKQIRDWIYVDDTCEAIYQVYLNGQSGERYCIGADSEVANIDIVKMVINKLGMSEDKIKFVEDRPGHDTRYATNISKMVKLGWRPVVSLSDGLDRTIQWIQNDYQKK